MKKRFLHLIIASLVSLGLQHAQAQTIFPQESTVSGSFGAGGTSAYQLSTNADGRLDLTLTSTGGTSINVNLFAEDGTTSLGGSGTGAGPITWSRDALTAGTYIITITSYYGNQSGSFTLSNHLEAAPVANDVEPNDDYMHAQTLNQDDSVHGHIFYYDFHHGDSYDWYKLKINSDGMLKLTLTNNLHNGNIVGLTLYDSTGTSSLAGFNSSNFNTLLKDGLAAGTYYLAITTYYQNGDFAAYTITDSLLTYQNASDAEPDNAPYQGETLAANTTVPGHEGFVNTAGSSDGADWYRLNYTGSGDLSFIFNQEPHLSDNSFAAVEFRVYNDTTHNAIYFNTFTTANGTADLTGLAQGNYWILVSPSVNYFGFASYSIQNSFQSVLPVTLLNFNVTRQDKNALLSWATSNETNNKGFEVQKSPDGQHFAGIGFVHGQTSSSSVQSYSFVDPAIASGTSYYRLQQTDIDGNFRYSPVVVLNYTQLVWTVLGNASTGTATVQLQLDKSADVAIQIISTNGSVIKTTNKGKFPSGAYAFPLDMHNTAAGAYIIRIFINGEAYTKMIMK